MNEQPATITFPLPPELEAPIRQLLAEQKSINDRLTAYLDGFKIGKGFATAAWYAFANVDLHTLTLTPVGVAPPTSPTPVPDVFIRGMDGQAVVDPPVID